MSDTFTRSARAALFALALGVASTSAVLAQESIVGDWEGSVNSPAQGEVGMVVHVTAGEDGMLSGTLDVRFREGSVSRSRT